MAREEGRALLQHFFSSRNLIRRRPEQMRFFLFSMSSICCFHAKMFLQSPNHWCAKNHICEFSSRASLLWKTTVSQTFPITCRCGNRFMHVFFTQFHTFSYLKVSHMGKIFTCKMNPILIQ